MKKKEMSNKFIKENGVHYTPKELSFYMANILVDELLKEKNYSKIKVLDPACGDGELLIALAYILKENNIVFEMYGVDTNLEELNLAQERLKEIGVKLITKNLDFIEDCDKFHDFDLIIANPPYVRTQNMDNNKRKNLKKFAVNGRFDLYQLFFSAITNSLKYDGLMCIITSNKFMFNKAGEKTRQFLCDNYDIKFISDLGDSKIFEASVLPAIFLGQKKLFINPELVNSVKVYETLEKANFLGNIFEALYTHSNCIAKKNGHNYKIEFGTIDAYNNKEPWAIKSKDDCNFIEKINKYKHCILSDWANVKVGIKTTADKVFIKNRMEDFHIDDVDLIHEMIFSKNTGKWFPKEEPSRYILYPYKVSNNKQIVINLENYTSTQKYINNNRDILKARKYFENTKKKWYEIWVCHSLLEFKNPKIVVPDISSEPKFLYDNTGKLIDGNCYWITLKKDIPLDYLYLILGICNSKFMEQYHDTVFQNKLYSGKRRYVSQYLNKYPMINPNSFQAKKIIESVKNIIESKTDILKNEETIEQNILNYWESEVNEQ